MSELPQIHEAVTIQIQGVTEGSLDNKTSQTELALDQVPTNDPIPAKYSDGVSNGDVEWLFRGKLKKIARKSVMSKSSLNLDTNSPTQAQIPTRPLQENQTEQSVLVSTIPSPTSKPSTPVMHATASSSNLSKLLSQQLVTSDGSSSSILVPSACPSPSSPSYPSSVKSSSAPSASPLSSSIPPANASILPPPQSLPAEKSRRIDILKFGRSRSVSATSSAVTITPATAAPTLGISPSSPLLDQSNSSRQQSDPGVAESLSRSNSSSKRLIFNSISSKFRPASSLNSEAATSTSASTNFNSNIYSSAKSKSNNSNILNGLSNPTSSSSSSSPSQPRVNYMGVLGDHAKDHAVDLVSAVSKPPAGLGFRRRLSSSSSARPQLSSLIESLTTKASSTSLVDDGASRFFQKSTRNTIGSNRNKTRPPVAQLANVRLKRVAFDIDKLSKEPQQQIPSRNPQKGNVLIPEDLVAPVTRLSQGITVSESNSSSSKARGKQTPVYSERELAIAKDAQRRALIEAEKHAQEAYRAATRLAAQVAQMRLGSGTSMASSRSQSNSLSSDWLNDPDQVISPLANKFAIDTPIHAKLAHFESSKKDDGNSKPQGQGNSLEAIYTRCCHLREILPIPATLKQLKGKSRPLQVLKLLNPKPTLVDALSFSDFLSITPVIAVIFDNVSLTTEMFGHFLSALVNSTTLEKLLLRNVTICEQGWLLLCAFLLQNRTLRRLDISQQKIRPETRPECYRNALNWDVFIRAVISRGGIEELVINGVNLTDKVFDDLVNKALKIATFRLGIASVGLNTAKAQIISDWILTPGNTCCGVDMAFNDLSQGQLRPFIDAFARNTVRLIFFLLHSTHLTDSEQVGELLEALTLVKTLRFLDLSAMPELFPEIVPHLSRWLPQYSSLRRLHLDLNEISGRSLCAIADFLPKISTLCHVSLLGNCNLSHGAAAALYNAIKTSQSIHTFELEYEFISDSLAQKMAFYLMRNMGDTMNQISAGVEPDNDEDLIFDGTLLMETAEKLLVEEDKKSDNKDYTKIQSIVTKALYERTNAVRAGIHRIIALLFEKRFSGELSLEGKERLLRFCLLDISLEKLLPMIEEHQQSDEKSKENEQVASTIAGPAPSSPAEPDHLSPPYYADLSSKTGVMSIGPILAPHDAIRMDFNDRQEQFQPHQVVTEATPDGTDVPVDFFTGRPVLMRSTSQTSTQAKEQELEEGELHRLSFYLQQQQDDESNLEKKLPGETPETSTPTPPLLEPLSLRDIPTLNTLPSGSALREAILAAKGFHSVTDLIDRINRERATDIPGDGGVAGTDVSMAKTNSVAKSLDPSNEEDSGDTDVGSIDSGDDPALAVGREDNTVVGETLDRLLNEAQRVRLNKQDV